MIVQKTGKQYTAFIPLGDIERIQVYINTERKTLAQIRQAAGADYVINGTLYNMATGAVNCHLKADGQVIAAPAYCVPGYAWNGAADFGMELLPNVPKSGDIGKANYIACANLIIDGKPIEDPCKDPARLGKRGRTAMGLKAGKLALYCSKDGSGSASTPETLRDMLQADGWDSAVMLDSGGSSQCDFLGKTVTSSRKVQHLILVYLTKAACPYKEPTKPVKRGSIGEDARWVQWMLNKHGAGLAVDGRFGKASVAALTAFQKSVFSVPGDWDGICGPATRRKLR